ncbi:MAG: hypothetical protein ACM3YE_17205 [Bacteroidota bacterium]
MINGKKFSWEDISVNLPQGTAIDIDSIEYSDKKEDEEIYGKGSNPTGWGSGNYSAEGKMTLKREEHEKLTTALIALGSKSIYQHKPFPIVVNYANDDQPIVTDVLRSCKLTANSTGPKQGDKSENVEVSFKILGGIVWNGKEANI